MEDSRTRSLRISSSLIGRGRSRRAERNDRPNQPPADSPKALKKDIAFVVFIVALSVLVLFAVMALFLAARFIYICAGNTVSMASALTEQSAMTQKMLESYQRQRQDDVARVADGFDTVNLSKTKLKDADTNLALTLRLQNLTNIAEFEGAFITDPNGTVVLSTESGTVGTDYIPTDDASIAATELSISEGYTLYVMTGTGEIDASWTDFYSPGLTFGDLDADGTRTAFIVDCDTGKFLYYNHLGTDLSGENISSHGLTPLAKGQSGTLTLNGAYCGYISIDGSPFFCYCREMDMAQFGRVQIYLAVKSLRSSDLKALLWSLLALLLAGVLEGISAIILRRHGYGKKDLAIRLTLLGLVLTVAVGVASFGFQTVYTLSNTIDGADYGEALLYEKQQYTSERTFTEADYNVQAVQREARLLAAVMGDNASMLTSGGEMRVHLNDAYQTVTDSNGLATVGYENVPLLMQAAAQYGLERISIVGENGYTLFSGDENWYEVLDGDDSKIRDVLNCKEDVAYVREVDENGTTRIRAAAYMKLYTYVGDSGTVCYTTPEAYSASLEEGYAGPVITAHNGVLILQMPEENIITASESYRDAYIVKVSEYIQFATIRFYSEGEYTAAGDLVTANTGVVAQNDFRVINGERCFVRTVYSEQYGKVLETSIPTTTVFLLRGVIVILFVLSALLLFGLILLRFTLKVPAANRGKALTERIDAGFTVRPKNYIPFKERTASGKTEQLVRYGFVLFMLLVVLLMLYVAVKPSALSSLGYVLSGNFTRGINYFSLMACGLVLCAVVALTMFVSELTRFIIFLLKDYRGEKVRLALLFVKVAIVLAGILTALYIFGLDIKGLFTSLGIVTAIIGVGCKDIFNDLMWGMSNIMSDKYRVGEVIQAGNYSGRIVEVNLRTVKLVDDLGKTKVVGNAALSSFVNESRQHPGAWVEIAVSPDTDLDALKPRIREVLPTLGEGNGKLLSPIRYLGVTRFTADKVYLGFTALCEDKDSEYCKWFIHRKATELLKRLTEEAPQA